MAPGEVPFAVDPSLPSNVQSAIRTAESQGQAWDGGGVGPLAQAAPSSNAAAARPAFTPAQQAEIEAKQSRTLTPEEVAQRGYRPGSIVQVDGYGTETVKQAPAQDRAAMSDAERKSILAAKAKVPQLQNAIRGLSRIDEALKGLEGGLVDTGPLDQYAQRYTKAGQELESAVGAIQNSFLALTRVPGIGAQSDLEARIAALQYPSLGKDPEVNRRTMEQLKFFAQDLASAYQSLLQNGAGTNPQPAPQDAAQGNAPSIIRYDAQGNRL